MTALLDRVPLWVIGWSVGVVSTLLISWSVHDYSRNALLQLTVKPVEAVCEGVAP